MKEFRKLITICLAGTVILTAAGCAGNDKPAVKPSDTDGPLVTEVETAGSETLIETDDSSEELASTHDVKVESQTIAVMVDSSGSEYKAVLPFVFIDGGEATEINTAISNHIQETYPQDNVDDGFAIRYAYGVKSNSLSLLIRISHHSSDYFTTEVYNYDLDTMNELEAGEVTKRLGMTDVEFFSKTDTVIRDYCDGMIDLDLDASIASINYDKITPFILPDGDPGVLACIVYASDSQFGGMESLRCFNLATMDDSVPDIWIYE
ncbi:MAG: hypothetical protein K5665_07610 [Saccharofermentans sp.]|nr:hypothetical protein [Saccharofermentans sp.]